MTAAPPVAISVPSVEPVPARHARATADLDRTRSWDDLPARDLGPGELLDLAASVADRSELWRESVAFGAGDQRHYVCLHRDAHVDVWLLCWTPRADTGWHDHDVSSGAVVVTQGALVEHNLAIGQDSVVTEVGTGRGYAFGPDHIHRLTGSPEVVGGSVSVHAYSPPLWRMGQYSVREGVLRRTSVSYADELRPIA